MFERLRSAEQKYLLIRLSRLLKFRDAHGRSKRALHGSRWRSFPMFILLLCTKDVRRSSVVVIVCCRRYIVQPNHVLETRGALCGSFHERHMAREGTVTWGNLVQQVARFLCRHRCMASMTWSGVSSPWVPPPPPPGPPSVPEAHEQGDHEGLPQPIYCGLCSMWLNGPGQWADHQIGKKHRKRIKAGARAQRADRAMKFLALFLAAKWDREQRYRDEQVHVRLALRLARIYFRERVDGQ